MEPENHKTESIYDIIQRTGGFPIHCAHRGGASEFGPENTMYSFEKSVKHHARLLEIDLRLTKDGELVLMHDGSVGRTTDGVGLVSEFTLEIKKLDAAYNYPDLRGSGITVPTFKEVLERFLSVEDLLFMFDFKDELAVEKTLEMIQVYKIPDNRYLLGSVFEAPNNLLQKLRNSKDIPVITDITQTIKIITAYTTGFLGWYTFTQDIFGYVLTSSTSWFWGKGLIDALHERGVKVLVCGPELSKVEIIKQAIEFGVDFVMTDDPDLYPQSL